MLRMFAMVLGLTTVLASDSRAAKPNVIIFLAFDSAASLLRAPGGVIEVPI